jgi:hypothetical protein
MAEYTVAGLIDTLKNNYDLGDIIVATWWSKDDVSTIVDDEEWDVEVNVDDVWANVSRKVDVALDYAESDVNDEIVGFVTEYVQKGK